PATTTIPVTTLPAEPVRPPSAPAPATVIPAGPAPVASNGPRIDSLSFSFSGKSWISVRDATGQELVYGLKAPGQTVTVTGQAPFSINIGNVNVTTLSRNGKPVNLKPYTRGEIASFRLMR
ncbi:MAG: RodZ domain-containing protein, partial [Perlucidibaca sp.]